MSEPSTESQPGNEPPALTPTAWAILGYLSLKSQSGYEILRAARESIAEFWGVSPGQLYPQLQNLAELGFIQAQGAAEGPRAKQQWSLTGAGRQALQQWFAAPSEPLKIRDEALAKLFFAAKGGPAGRDSGLLARLQAERRRIQAQLDRTLAAALPDGPLPDPQEAAKLGAPELAVRYGAHAARTARHWAKDLLDKDPRNRAEP